jgi:hypothetical protein
MKQKEAVMANRATLVQGCAVEKIQRITMRGYQ